MSITFCLARFPHLFPSHLSLFQMKALNWICVVWTELHGEKLQHNTPCPLPPKPLSGSLSRNEGCCVSNLTISALHTVWLIPTPCKSWGLQSSAQFPICCFLPPHPIFQHPAHAPRLWDVFLIFVKRHQSLLHPSEKQGWLCALPAVPRAGKGLRSVLHYHLHPPIPPQLSMIPESPSQHYSTC